MARVSREFAVGDLPPWRTYTPIPQVSVPTPEINKVNWAAGRARNPSFSSGTLRGVVSTAAERVSAPGLSQNAIRTLSHSGGPIEKIEHHRSQMKALREENARRSALGYDPRAGVYGHRVRERIVPQAEGDDGQGAPPSSQIIIPSSTFSLASEKKQPLKITT